jgi:hypothetical protein
VTDSAGSKISKYDPASGQLLATLGSHGTGLRLGQGDTAIDCHSLGICTAILLPLLPFSVKMTVSPLRPAIQFGSVDDVAFDPAGGVYISDGAHPAMRPTRPPWATREAHFRA